MTSLTRSAVVALAVAGLSSCVSEDGNGRIVTEQRAVQAFQKVKVEDGLRVTITQGPRSVLLTTDENLRSFFQADVRGDTLVLKKLSNFSLNPTGEVVFEIMNEVLEGLDVSGGAQVSADATPTSRWRLTASGGSVVTARNVATPKLDVEASGASEVTLFGSANEARVKGSGGSKVNTVGVTTVSVDVDASGGSTLNVAASSSAKGIASGNSTVNVVGNPQTRTIDATGSSTVTYTDSSL